MAPKFSKQNILDYHNNRVEIMEVELSVLVQKKTAAQEVLSQLFDNLNRLLEDLSEFQNGVLDLSSINQARFNIRHNQKLIEMKQNEIAQIEKEVNNKREELLLAKQDEAVFDKLKEKELDQYHQKVKKQENDLQADIYIALTHRKHVGV